MKVFISYSSKDRDLVTALADDLDLMDHEVWYDQVLNRTGGHRWWKAVCEAIRGCEVFLYTLSPHILRSEACRREYKYATDLGKPVLPLVVVDLDIRFLPRDLQESQLLNFRERTNQQKKSLRDSLKNMPPCLPLPDNAVALEPPVPLDPVGALIDRIHNLTFDPDIQKVLIVDIDNLQEDEQYEAQVPELLRVLLERNDILTGRNIKRVEALLSTLQARTPTEATQVVLSSAREEKHAEPAPGTRITDEKGITMVYVPAGKFLMGSTQQQVDESFEQAKQEGSEVEKKFFTDQMPQHEQIIQRPFWLDLTPVTNESYARFIKEGGYKTRRLWTPAGWKWVQENKKHSPIDYNGFIDPQQPRVAVTWFEAYAYCRWRNGKLPTEAEWEWAARGRENLVYPWGNTFVADNVIYKNSYGGASDIGDGIRSKGASWIGALDMSGNVWEWCSSLYQPYPYKLDYRRESNEDARNWSVLRGGSWYDDSSVLPSACRSYALPDTMFKFIGFRCARSIE